MTVPYFLDKNLCVVLDLDDTLYLETSYVLSGFKMVSYWIEQQYGIKDFYQDLRQTFFSNHRSQAYQFALSKRGIYSENLVEQLSVLYRDHVPNISLEKDAAGFLESVKNKKYLITDGRPTAQWNKIKALNLLGYFEKIIVTGDLGKAYYKPSPRSFSLLQAEQPDKPFIYIADNPKKDFLAPAQLGWKDSIRMNRRGSLHHGEATPDGIKEVVNFSDLHECLIN